jgi:8-oxo-dGTP pyrophosphatase MutT (NUDIX family)
VADQAVQPIRPAATVILIRDVPDGGQHEIFMLRRTSQAAFAGGMYVFPGGRVDGDDHLHSYDAWRTGPTERQAAQQAALGAEWRGYWIAGIRETFEEAGLLLAYHENGVMVGYDESSSDRFDHYRHDVHSGAITLAEICATEKLSLAVDHIHFFNRWITPLGRPRRFDTRFFIAEAPPAQTGQHDDKETVDSVWITPHRALERHAADDFGLMGVTLRQLQTLNEYRSVADVREMLETLETHEIFRPVLPPGA